MASETVDASSSGPPPDNIGEYFPPSASATAVQKLLAQGQVEAAEETLRRALTAARDRTGSDSIHCRDAAIELAYFLAEVGDTEGALASFREAAAEPHPPSLTGLRQHLTSEFNAAILLGLLGRLDEQESVLTTNLKKRLQYFGEDHPGYALALEARALLHLRKDAPAEALPLLDRAVAVFGRTRHPNFATALGLRAIALKALERPESSFSELPVLPPEQSAAIARKVIEAAAFVGHIKVRRRMFHDLYGFVTERLGDDHPVLLELLWAIANQEKAEGNNGKHRARQETIRQIIALHERQGQEAKAIAALGKLADAQNDAGLFDEARSTYFLAVSRAQQRADMSQLAQTLTDVAQFLASRGQADEAERMFRASVSAGQRGRESEVLGRAHADFGVFLQHGGRGPEASEHLEEALRLMPAGSSKVVSIREHRDALCRGVPCPCATRRAQADRMEYLAAALSALPSGIAQNIEIADGEAGPEVRLRLFRSLTPDESRQLEAFRATTHAAFPYHYRITVVESESANV